MTSDYEAEWEKKFVRVVYERGHEEFFERFLLATKVKHLLIVSPWITALENENYQLREIADKIIREKTDCRVFMRHPKKERWNYEAVQILKSCPTVRIWYNNELHAKVYVCRCDPFGFALVGSANLSGNATRAHEIGLMLDGKGRGKETIEELQRLGTDDLLARAGTNELII